MRVIKNQIKEVIDFTSVSSVTEADAMFDTYLNHIKDAFKRMRRATNWTMRDATHIYNFAISTLTDRYVEALLKLDKFARSNYKFYE